MTNRNTMLATWFSELLHIPPELSDGAEVTPGGRPFVLKNGILRSRALVSEAQKQTEDTFGFKWNQRDTFESEASLNRMKTWLMERYGTPAESRWHADLPNDAVILDAGCGGGMSGLEYFGAALKQFRYVGADISSAVDVARERFRERGIPGEFIQSDLNGLPLHPQSVDLIFSEGVLHHTDSTERAFHNLAGLVKPGGWFLFYVYRRKGPVREFTDDYIRDRLQDMSPEAAWEAMKPLTRLGRTLGELQIELEIPEDIGVLDIPAGKIDLQRFFYWHVCKAFYREDLNLDEMNHINFDWFAPRNAHRQSPEEVRSWCASEGFEIVREVVEEAGITIVARKNG